MQLTARTPRLMYPSTTAANMAKDDDYKWAKHTFAEATAVKAVDSHNYESYFYDDWCIGDGMPLCPPLYNFHFIHTIAPADRAVRSLPRRLTYPFSTARRRRNRQLPSSRKSALRNNTKRPRPTAHPSLPLRLSPAH